MDLSVRLSDHAEDLLRDYGETLFPTQPQALRYYVLLVLLMPHAGNAPEASRPINTGAPSGQRRWGNGTLRSLQAPKGRAIFAPASSALAAR